MTKYIHLFSIFRPSPGEGLEEQVFEMDVQEDEVDCGNEVEK